MQSPLLPVRETEAQYSCHAAAIDERDRMKRPFEPHKSPISLLAIVEAQIGNRHRIRPIKLLDVSEIQAVLGEIDGAFRLVSFEFHGYSVARKIASGLFYVLQKIGVRA
jgi:hypothetical protein